jgi:cold shock protein
VVTRERGLDYDNGFGCSDHGERFQRVVAFSELCVETSDATCFNRCGAAAMGAASCRGGSKMALGTVKWFNDAKGYGFISRADDGKDVFVHYSSIAGDGFRTLNQGQTVEYEEQQGPKGLFAARVMKVAEAATQ